MLNPRIVWLLCGGMLLAAGDAVFAQPDKPKLTISAAALDTSTEVIKRLATVEEHVKSRQWEQAILILQQVETDHGDALVAIDSRRYLNVTTYINSVLANFPPEGLAVYREKYDAQAKQWLIAGLASRDPALLEKIVQNAFVSRPCDDALFVLGEWAWDRGEFPAAREYWRKLLKLPNPPGAGQPQSVLRYPDSRHSQAEVVSRIVLCHLMEGDESLAKIWRDYLAKEYPEARGKLAGREGVFAEILKDVFKAAESWRFPHAPADTLTFAGNPQRNPIYPKAPELGPLQWEVPLPEHHHDPATLRARPEPSLSYFPVVADDTVFFADPDRIYALDLHTGKAKWPISGDGTIKEPGDLDLAAIYRAASPTSERNNHRIGQPRFTLTIHENRLYARMGSPITGQVSKASSSPNSRLVCLDLTKQGKIIWNQTPAEVLSGIDLEARRQWAFEGAPVTLGGRVFAALRQSHPQTESFVVCLDAETGKLEWTRRVASAVSNIAEEQNYISHHLLTLGENMVFFVPEFGVVTALDANSGRLMWAVTYPAFTPEFYSEEILKQPLKQGFTPCLFHRGVIYAAPTDSESILAISAKTGVILWEQQIPFSQDQIRHLLGVVDDQLVLSGNRLWILDAITGRVEVPAQLDSGRHPETDGYGRGLIADDTIYWPKRADLEIHNLAGERTKQPQRLPGGNLTATETLLLVAEPKRLAAYGNFAKVKETQRGVLSQNPAAAAPYYRLARAEAALGNLEEAVTQNLEAIKRSADQDQIAGKQLEELAREHQFRLRMDSGNQAISAGDFGRAVRNYQEAVPYASNDSAKAEALRLFAEALTEQGKIEAAVAAHQSILDDRELAELPFNSKTNRTRGDSAASRIERLIQQHGRSVYAEFDRKASELFSDRIREKNFEAAEEVLRRFPNLSSIAETKQRLAKLEREEGDWRNSLALWQEILKGRSEPETRRQTLLEMAQTLEENGYHRPAREAWQNLLREFPDAPITLNGKTSPAADVIPARLEREPFQRLDQLEPKLPLGQRYQRELPPGSHVVIPEDDSPAAGLDCVLVQVRDLTCVDQTTGTTRWQRPIDQRLRWAAYGRTHLLLGTANSLWAVALETGETIWRLELADPASHGREIHQFELLGDRVLVLKDDGVDCLDAETGRQIWRKIQQGKLSETWSADEDFLVVQTKDPLAILVMETRTGNEISRHPVKSPWTSPPVRLEKGHTKRPGFVVSLGNRIRAFSAYDAFADPCWEYRDAYSAANSPPHFWPSGGELIMLLDGDTLIKVQPETGEKLWAKSLAHAPLDNPEETVILDEGHVYAATSDRVFCFQIADGRIVWQQPLPANSGWTLQKEGRFLIALAKGSETRDSAVIFFDARTGQRGQELDEGPFLTAARFRTQTPVLISRDQLIGWGRMDFSSAGELTRPAGSRDD